MNISLRVEMILLPLARAAFTCPKATGLPQTRDHSST
jgi:hypothetical protein